MSSSASVFRPKPCHLACHYSRFFSTASARFSHGLTPRPLHITATRISHSSSFWDSLVPRLQCPLVPRILLHAFLLAPSFHVCLSRLIRSRCSLSGEVNSPLSQQGALQLSQQHWPPSLGGRSRRPQRCFLSADAVRACSQHPSGRRIRPFPHRPGCEPVGHRCLARPGVLPQGLPPLVRLR